MQNQGTYNRLFPGGMKALPWMAPPPGFLSIDRNRAVQIAIGAGEVLLEQIVLAGSSYEGWLVSAGIVGNNPGATRFFTIKEGGVPIRDYVSVQVPLGQPDLMGPLFIPLRPNIPVELYATNTSGAIFGVRYRLFGWYYPQSEAR